MAQKRAAIEVAQCFIRIQGERAEWEAWSDSLQADHRDRLLAVHQPSRPEHGPVWRCFALSADTVCLSQTSWSTTRPNQGLAHALLLANPLQVDAFQLCRNPNTFRSYCAYAGSGVPPLNLEKTISDRSALRTLGLLSNPDRLGTLIEAAVLATPADPLWFVPAGSAASLGWFQALSYCLPQPWRTEVTFSTREEPGDALPFAWIAVSEEARVPSRGTCFRVLDMGPSRPPAPWARSLADRILKSDFQSVVRALASLTATVGEENRRNVLESAEVLAPVPNTRDEMLEAAHLAFASREATP